MIYHQCPSTSAVLCSWQKGITGYPRTSLTFKSGSPQWFKDSVFVDVTQKKYEKTCPNHGVKLFCPALKPQSGPTRACQKQWARGWNKKSKPRPDCRLLWRLQSHPLSQTHLKESYFKPGTSEYPCFLHLIWSGCLWGMRIIGFFNKKITHFFKHLKAS